MCSSVRVSQGLSRRPAEVLEVGPIGREDGKDGRRNERDINGDTQFLKLMITDMEE